MGVDTEQRANAVGVLVFKIRTIPADNLIVDPRFLYLEARGVDQQIELVGFAVKNRALLADLGDAFAVDPLRDLLGDRIAVAGR